VGAKQNDKKGQLLADSKEKKNKKEQDKNKREGQEQEDS